MYILTITEDENLERPLFIPTGCKGTYCEDVEVDHHHQHLHYHHYHISVIVFIVLFVTIITVRSTRTALWKQYLERSPNSATSFFNNFFNHSVK